MSNGLARYLLKIRWESGILTSNVSGRVATEARIFETAYLFKAKEDDWGSSIYCTPQTVETLK